MTYTVGDRRISIDNDELDASEKELILAHLKLFKYCLNNASYKFLISSKKIVHLYSDIITIYSTLLRKVPNYDDITLMTNRTRLNLLKLEDDFNKILGDKCQGDHSNKGKWEDKNYEVEVKRICLLCVESLNEIFELIVKNLNCIDVFFNSFDNLKKLLIPFLSSQTKSIQKSMVKALYLFKLTTIVDEVSSIKELTPTIIKQLRKIEKITGGIERESIILDTAFVTFDPSLQQYTSILLGKAILKRDVADADCQIIRRREVCFQAAEHVVSIPLTEDQSSNLSMKHLVKYIVYICILLAIVSSLVLYRIVKVMVG
ncbi:DEHA2D07414p [Debaryomyces hansenii CBS767]|uniref:DEHA2D07414p n=1 Tax=Debaryomyces hansenii (strain ATCC 36239 / CBS 767 / BCRC 21394 / JCM 1990 / NBRC 0083 / IGC 2968) TaxID=284592 RepID=B5RTE8_DEBHA|nr:DEHA2D07414p [Debaryomyces hansenii CBS767]CAR65633.1 DEHA2D07414p [Debaryomyces hansenii CBS767]|eukprot:XP_002770277.1 DEHA2D07414p [Debaryomyces hansenii CBS767]